MNKSVLSCVLVSLSVSLMSCNNDNNEKKSDEALQPASYCKTDEQRAALGNVKQVCDSLFLLDFGAMDYRLDEMLEVCEKNPDFNDFMNLWAHGMFLDLPDSVMIETSHTSCTAFAGRLADGAPVMGRNMDATVRNPYTGEMLPMTYFALHTKPANGYESISFSESTMLSKNFSPKQMKDGKTDISFLAMLPYVICDGINEKGLAVTQLTLFGNPSYAADGTGTRTMNEALIIRTLLDKCQNVAEAVEFAKTLKPHTTMAGNDLHYMITDADGNYAVLEWVKAIDGQNELQVVTDVPCISNTFCSARAKELSEQHLFDGEMILPYNVCWLMAHENEEYLQRYFNLTPADTTGVFNMSNGNCIYRLGSLQNAYDHPQGGVPGVFADTEEAMKVLASAFFSRTDGPITMSAQGPYEKTLWGCIYNNRDKQVDISLNENEHVVYHFGFDQFK